MMPHKKKNIKYEFKHTIEEHRRKIDELHPETVEPIYYEKSILIKISLDYSALIKIYRPENIQAPYPTIFYIPGTAFVANEFSFTSLISINLAKTSRCQVIVLRHRLAPEYPFPAGLSDIYSLLHCIIQNPKIFDIDKTKMVLMGYSSGGNFSATLAASTFFPGLVFQRHVLICPILDLSRSLVSHKNDFENKDAVIKDYFVDWFLQLYFPENIFLKHPLLSPSEYPIQQMRSLPPTDIVFGEHDRFRSDAEHYYLKLSQVNTAVFRMMVVGANHSLWWHQLIIAQSIGVRIKVALGLEPISRFSWTNNATFFRKNSSSNAPENNNLALIKI